MKLAALNDHVGAARARVEALEDELTAAYHAALRAQGRKAASRFRGAATAKSITAATNPWVPPDPSEILDSAQLAADAQKKAAPLQQRALRLAVPVGISFELANPLAAAFLAGLQQRSEQILAGFGDEIRKAISDAYEQGLSVPKAAQLIRSQVDAASEVQARLLARSDLVSIANGGSLLGAQIVADSAGEEGGGPVFKTWLTAGDERVRDDHAEADGQSVPLDQPFDVGGESLQYPGDPEGSLEQTANCRCTQIYGDSMTAAAGPEVSTLAMVAVHPRAAEAGALAVDGGLDVEELHVTLLFLGDASELDAEAVHAVLASVAKTLPPLEGAVGGAAHFAEGPDGFPSILLPDVKGLSTLQETVRAALADASIESPSEHGFLPHMTLTYAETPEVPDLEKIGSALHFDNVSVVIAGEQTDYPLTGDSMTAATRTPNESLSSGGTMKTALQVTPAPLMLRDFHLTAAAGEPTRWQATLLVEDEPTEDGRMIAAGAATWRQLPLPLAILDASMHSDGGEAPVCGRIDQIWRAGNAIQAAGVFDTSANGVEAERMVRERMITGISCDGVATESEMVVSRPEPDPEEEQELLDEVGPVIDGEPVPDYEEDLEYLFVATAYTIMGATICPAGAIARARIEVVASASCEETWTFVAPFEPSVSELSPVSLAASAGLDPRVGAALDKLDHATLPSRMLGYRAGMEAGILTLNDCLRAEGRSPMEGGDERAMPMPMSLLASHTEQLAGLAQTNEALAAALAIIKEHEEQTVALVASVESLSGRIAAGEKVDGAMIETLRALAERPRQGLRVIRDENGRTIGYQPEEAQ